MDNATNRHPVWIGYGTDDLLLDGVPPGTTLYLSLTSKSAGGAGGMGRLVWTLNLSYVAAGGGEVHYLLFPYASALTIAGEAVDQREREAASARTDQLRKLFLTRLCELGYPVRQATVAAPKDLTLCEGTPGEWCEWDRAGKTFSRRAAG